VKRRMAKVLEDVKHFVDLQREKWMIAVGNAIRGIAGMDNAAAV